MKRASAVNKNAAKPVPRLMSSLKQDGGLVLPLHAHKPSILFLSDFKMSIKDQSGAHKNMRIGKESTVFPDVDPQSRHEHPS